MAGKLEATVAAELWRHVAECDLCQLTFGTATSLRDPVHEGPTAPASAGVREDSVGFSIEPSVVQDLPVVPGYEPLEEIGAGGMGIVYRAWDPDLDRYVAIKVLPPGHGPESPLCVRFLLEARLMARLQHPAVPPVHKVGYCADGRPYIVMKLIMGQTLAELLASRPHPDADRTRFLSIFEAVCGGVGYAHEQGIIHRDLKPGNIMVGAFGEVQVMDWGIARVFRPESAPGGSVRQLKRPDMPPGRDQSTPRQKAVQTLAGSVIGTPPYAPPEQVRGELEKIGPWSDVFALGAILCTILTGAPPYRGDNPAEVLRKAEAADLADAFARLDRCGAEDPVVQLCKRCLNPDPRARPRTAGEVAAEMARIRATLEERLRRAELERAAAELRATEQAKRRRLWIGLAGVAILGAITSGLFAVRALQAQAKALAASEAERKARENEARLRKLAEQKEAEAIAAARLARRAQEEGEIRLARLSVTLDLLHSAFADLNIDTLREEHRPLEEVLGERFRRLAERLLNEPIADPLSHAAMLHQLGESLHSLGYYREAMEVLERAVQLRSEQLGPEHLETLRACLAYGQSLAGMGKYQEARTVLEEVYERARDQRGGDDPFTLKAAVELGYVDYLLGRFEECVQLLEPLAAPVVEDPQGAVQDDLQIQLLEVLAEGYAGKGDFERSLVLLRRVYEARKNLFGPTHSETLVALNNLAVVTFRSGDREGAVRLFEEAYRLASARLGPDHPSVLTKLNNLGLVYKAIGDYEKAAEALSRCLRLTEERLGPDHPHTAQSLNNLAVLYDELGRYDEAEPLYRRALELRERLLGPDHPHTINTRYSLGLVYLRLGKTEEARAQLQKALEALERRQFSHDRAARIVARVAAALEESELWADAIAWRKSWATALEGGQEPRRDEAAVQLALVARDYLELGEPEQATLWANRAAEHASAPGAPAWVTVFAEALRVLARGDQKDPSVVQTLERAYQELSGVGAQAAEPEELLATSFVLEELIRAAELTGDKESLARWRLEKQRVREVLLSEK